MKKDSSVIILMLKEWKVYINIVYLIDSVRLDILSTWLSWQFSWYIDIKETVRKSKERDAVWSNF